MKLPAENDNERKPVDKLVIMLTVFIVVGGMAFTAFSFCVYYLSEPRNTNALALICAIDFLYNLLSICLLFKFIIVNNKWMLKGFIGSVAYIVAFIIVAVLLILIDGARDSMTPYEAQTILKNDIIGIVCYAFFTGASIYLALALLLLLMVGASGGC